MIKRKAILVKTDVLLAVLYFRNVGLEALSSSHKVAYKIEKRFLMVVTGQNRGSFKI